MIMIRPSTETSTAVFRGVLFTVHQILMADGPQTGADTDESGAKRDPVRLGIALAADKTLHVALLAVDLAVGVVYPAVEQVEDISRDDRREGHGTPVLA